MVLPNRQDLWIELLKCMVIFPKLQNCYHKVLYDLYGNDHCRNHLDSSLPSVLPQSHFLWLECPQVHQLHLDHGWPNNLLDQFLQDDHLYSLYRIMITLGKVVFSYYHRIFLCGLCGSDQCRNHQSCNLLNVKDWIHFQREEYPLEHQLHQDLQEQNYLLGQFLLNVHYQNLCRIMQTLVN